MNASKIIDCNVYLSRWPCRRLPFDDTSALVEHLQSNGVTQAWAGNFEALLHKDVQGVNLRTAEECRRYGKEVLLPVGCVNPALPDWQEDLRRCHEQHGMNIIRLHPGYHGYVLSEPFVTELLDLAATARLIVQIAVRMEDPRTQHPRLRVADVDIQPLTGLMPKYPTVPFIFTNALQVVRGSQLGELAGLPNACVEISTLEGIGGLENFIRTFPFQQVLFGSHAPFFLLQAALLKLTESEAGQKINEDIMAGNAEKLLAVVRA